ncbi:MAG: TrmH family RNA methyltransferase [Vicinamibacterales bacterium]
MKLVPIDTPDDPRLAVYQAIGDAELLRARGLFVAEGRLVVCRVLEDRRFRVMSLMVTPTALAALGPERLASSPHTEVHVCELRLFRATTGFNIHRGCLAMVERPPTIEPKALVGTSTGAAPMVVLEDVADADNVGSIFRSAAAFGAAGVLLSPACCDPLYRKAVRTSMAATLRVPYARVHPWPQALDWLKGEGYALAALTPREPARGLSEFAAGTRPGRLAILLGSEGAGLSEGALARADVRVRIPITSMVDSLNVGVACGIALALLADSDHPRVPPDVR